MSRRGGIVQDTNPLYEGAILVSISSNLPLRSAGSLVRPVTFPLGRPRLGARPIWTGSPVPAACTMGILTVAC